MSILSQLASSIARLDQRLKAKRLEQANAPAVPVLDVDSLNMDENRVRVAMGLELEALYTSRGLDQTLAALMLGVPRVYLQCIQSGAMRLSTAEYKDWIRCIGGNSIAFTAAVNQRLGT